MQNKQKRLMFKEWLKVIPSPSMINDLTFWSYAQRNIISIQTYRIRCNFGCHISIKINQNGIPLVLLYEK